VIASLRKRKITFDSKSKRKDVVVKCYHAGGPDEKIGNQEDT
jgi:hypothetical protein